MSDVGLAYTYYHDSGAPDYLPYYDIYYKPRKGGLWNTTMTVVQNRPYYQENSLCLIEVGEYLHLFVGETDPTTSESYVLSYRAKNGGQWERVFNGCQDKVLGGQPSHLDAMLWGGAYIVLTVSGHPVLGSALVFLTDQGEFYKIEGLPWGGYITGLSSLTHRPSGSIRVAEHVLQTPPLGQVLAEDTYLNPPAGPWWGYFYKLLTTSSSSQIIQQFGVCYVSSGGHTYLGYAADIKNPDNTHLLRLYWLAPGGYPSESTPATVVNAFSGYSLYGIQEYGGVLYIYWRDGSNIYRKTATSFTSSGPIWGDAELTGIWGSELIIAESLYYRPYADSTMVVEHPNVGSIASHAVLNYGVIYTSILPATSQARSFWM